MKEGWTYKKLGEVGITQTGTTPSKSNSNNYGNYIPFIRPAEISFDGSGQINYDSEIKLSEEGLKNGRLFKKGSTLMVCIGSIGKLGFAERNISCNQQINVITPFDDYYPKYIFYAMSCPAFQRECLKIAQGAQATLPIINKGKWSNLLIPIPSSKDEQQRIMARLDAAFAHIDELKANAEKQLSEARTLFQKALSKAMEPKEGWEEKCFGEVCHYHKEQGIFKDMKYLGMEHMESSTGRIIGYMSSNDVLSTSFRFSKGDVLYGRLRPYLQKVYVAEFDGCCSTEVFPIRSEIVVPSFIKYWFLSSETTKKINATSAGCRMPRGNMNEVKMFPFSFPKEKKEQQRIVARLDSLSEKVRKYEEIQQKVIAECDALKQALLRKVFE